MSKLSGPAAGERRAQRVRQHCGEPWSPNWTSTATIRNDQNSYFLDPEAERKFIADSVESIRKASGQQPIGWNAYWMRNSPHTLNA
jgi:hypothetical protein